MPDQAHDAAAEATSGNDGSQPSGPAVDVATLLRARKLFGWPTAVLDELAALAQEAVDGRLGMAEWRKQDAALRAGVPVGTPVDPDTVLAARLAAGRAWVDAQDGTPEEKRLARLLDRLVALRPAPTDEQLWERLTHWLELRTTANQVLDPQERAETHRRTDEEIWRIRSWLTGPDAPYDSVTGLPWKLLGRYRWVEVRHVGWVPAPLDLARGRAQADADDETARRACLLTGNARPSAMIGAAGEMYVVAVTELARVVLKQPPTTSRRRRDLVAAFSSVWDAPAMRDLLLEATQDGWPMRYARTPRPRRHGRQHGGR